MQSGLVSRRLFAGHGVVLPAGVALTYPILPSRKLCRGTVRETFCCDLSRRRSRSKKKKSLSLPLRKPGPPSPKFGIGTGPRSEEHTPELQSRQYLVCRLLLAKI